MAEFALCFEAHRDDGQVWAVKHPLGNIDDDQDWTLAKQVVVLVPVDSQYRGLTALNPRAYFTGTCHHIEQSHLGLVIQ